MEKEQFYDFVENLIVPLFTGSYIDGEEESSSRDLEVALGHTNSILLKPTKADEYRIILRRSQPFKSFEVNLVKAILLEMTKIYAMNIDDPVYMQKLRSIAIEKAIIESITDSPASDTIIGIISMLDNWASRTYEGSPVRMGIFVNLVNNYEHQDNEVNFRDILSKEFFALLTDGINSFAEFDKKGVLINYVNVKNSKNVSTVAPNKYEKVARSCNDKRVGIVLTEKGDILIFYNRQLMFSKRNGKWGIYSHDEVIRLLYSNVSYTAKQIRRALYNTALDCSFGYKGACIIYLNKDKTEDALLHIGSADIISPAHFEMKKALELGEADKLYNLANSKEIRSQYSCTFEEYLNKNKCFKSKAVMNIIGGKKLQELDRRLLEEFVSIDGATIIDFDGTIIAVGAILKIEAGSLGGGRLAATKCMAKYGVGIKVSQDGIMQGFSADKHGNVKQIFNVG